VLLREITGVCYANPTEHQYTGKIEFLHVTAGGNNITTFSGSWRVSSERGHP
jgi:hypothetical protein